MPRHAMRSDGAGQTGSVFDWVARHDRRRTAKPGTIPLFDDSSVGLRAYLVLLAANMAGQPHVKHKGTELIAVQRGLVQVTVGGSDTPVLRAGDSILATRATVTGWQNLRAEPAALFWFLRD